MYSVSPMKYMGSVVSILGNMDKKFLVCFYERSVASGVSGVD